MSLHVDLKTLGNVLCVQLEGELDHHTASDLKDRLTKTIETENIRHIILNLEHLHFMDSSGLGVILGRYNQIKANDGEMIVCAISNTVEKMFSMSGLFKIIRLEESVEQALDRLGVA